MIFVRLAAFLCYVAGVLLGAGWFVQANVAHAVAFVAAGLALECAIALAGEARARA